MSPSYNDELYIALSSCYVAIGDFVSGIAVISKGIKVFPTNAQ